MRIDEIMNLTGASKATIYRWMERHPTLGGLDGAGAELANGLLGVPFPRPQRKEGRAVIWDEGEVRQWWDANESHIGRHPEQSNMIELPYERYRAAMSYPVDVYRDDDGNEVIEDPMASITKIEREGSQVRIWFADATEAVLFKIKFA